MERRGRDPGEDDRVVSPDHAPRPQSFRKLAERLDGGRGGRRLGVDLPWIPQDRELEVVAVSSGVQFVEIRHQGTGVAGPEDDGVHVLRLQRDPGHLVPVERVRDRAVAFPEATDHPLRIESGDVGPSARADDHRWHPFGNWQPGYRSLSPIRMRSAAFSSLRRIAHGLGEQHPLLGAQLQQRRPAPACCSCGTMLPAPWRRRTDRRSPRSTRSPRRSRTSGFPGPSSPAPGTSPGRTWQDPPRRRC